MTPIFFSSKVYAIDNLSIKKFWKKSVIGYFFYFKKRYFRSSKNRPQHYFFKISIDKSLMWMMTIFRRQRTADCGVLVFLYESFIRIPISIYDKWFQRCMCSLLYCKFHQANLRDPWINYFPISIHRCVFSYWTTNSWFRFYNSKRMTATIASVQTCRKGVIVSKRFEKMETLLEWKCWL